MNYSKVIVETREPYFMVKHKIFKVPVNDYKDSLKSFVEPFKEEAAQEYVSNYLAWAQDPGIVGLVGIEKTDQHILIDAAVRYEVD